MIGCALAIGRKLYQKLWGFDPDMLKWGVEDLDFSLKCWLAGHRILHDPKAVVGHRFRTTFDNFDAPIDHFLVNQLRMAWKNFTEGVWIEWLDRTRRRHCQQLSEHPEGLWARVWKMFCDGRESADAERAHLHGHRVHDEFWYADRFGLVWPRLAALPGESAAGGFQSPAKKRRAHGEAADPPSPSSSAPPPPPPKPTLTFLGLDANNRYVVGCGGPNSTPAQASKFYQKHTLQCVPNNDATKVTLNVVGGCATAPRLGRNNSTGAVSFEIRGQSGTDRNAPNATRIQAMYDGEVLAEAVVRVVVPRQIGAWSGPRVFSHLPEWKQVTTGSRPPFWGGSGYCWLWTDWLTLQVRDQFNANLSAIYEHQPVFEVFGGTAYPINQNLSPTGTYRDPVFAYYPNPPRQVNIQSQKPGRNYTDSETWPIGVRIAGHDLVGGIRGRTATFAHNTVTIVWRDVTHQ
jgi:hypothetical protein